MQYFPSVSEEEFQDGCQAFYDTIVSALDGNAWLQVENVSGILYIKKEYMVNTPSNLIEKATDIAQHKDEVLTDDEDPEVRIMMIPLVRA